MKKIISIVLTLVIVLGLCACGGEGGSATKEGLQVGFSRMAVMPDDSIQLAGGDSSDRQNTGYRDEITISCIAITEGDETVLLYSMDYITVSATYTDAAEAKITEATGVDADHILMNATHTHAAPIIRTDGKDGVTAYRQKFNDAAVNAAQAALEDQSSAEVYAGGVQTEGIAFVRHYLMKDGSYYGPNFGDSSKGYEAHACEADEEIQIIRFTRAAEDKKDVVLMNLGAHATFLQGGTIMSADYPSVVRQYIEENSDSHAAFFAGGIGNQVPTSKIAGESYSTDIDAYGQRVGQYVVEGLPNLTKVEGTELKLNIKTITKESCREGVDKLDQAKQTKEAGKTYGYKDPQTLKLITEYGFTSIYEANNIVSRANYPDTQDMTCATMSIGNLAFVMAPYEMAGVHSMGIKEESPYAVTFVTSCFEKHMGYLPTIEACTDYKSYEYCVTKFKPGTGEEMVTEYVSMLTELQGME